MQCLFALSEAQRSRRCGEKHMSETVTGYIDHVIFRNEDNGYTVMVLKGTKKEEELTCVGSFHAITLHWLPGSCGSLEMTHSVS